MQQDLHPFHAVRKTLDAQLISDQYIGRLLEAECIQRRLRRGSPGLPILRCSGDGEQAASKRELLLPPPEILNRTVERETVDFA